MHYNIKRGVTASVVANSLQWKCSGTGATTSAVSFSILTLIEWENVIAGFLSQICSWHEPVVFPAR